MSIKQLSAFAENRPGSVSFITNVLSGSGIDIRALNIADTTDFGIVRMIVSDCEKGKNVLKDSSCVVSITDVLCVEMSDDPGSLNKIIAILADYEINIEYMYAFIATSKMHAYVVIRVNDNKKAEDLLVKSGFKMVSEQDIQKL